MYLFIVLVSNADNLVDPQGIPVSHQARIDLKLPSKAYVSALPVSHQHQPTKMRCHQAIEVRVPAATGVKAKWVRIELRKVETLPGGGEANTYYDFVGPSPVNLWSTSDEYSLLRSVSSCFLTAFTFFHLLMWYGMVSKTSHSLSGYLSRYRPPLRSRTEVSGLDMSDLDWCSLKAAGIAYELVASVCTKGKK